MTLNELEQIIQDARSEGLPGETPILLAHQPNWPFAFSISSACIDHTVTNTLTYGSREPYTALLLCEGQQLCYGQTDWWYGETIKADEDEDGEEE